MLVLCFPPTNSEHGAPINNAEKCTSVFCRQEWRFIHDHYIMGFIGVSPFECTHGALSRTMHTAHHVCMLCLAFQASLENRICAGVCNKQSEKP